MGDDLVGYDHKYNGEQLNLVLKIDDETRYNIYETKKVG
jgi:hypothetical protein